jgi:hypothetical protein
VGPFHLQQRRLDASEIPSDQRGSIVVRGMEQLR